MFLACSEAELEFHFLKYSLTSYSPSTHFLAFRLIWGFWKWSQMIPHITKHWFCHQNHVSSMLRSWVRILLLEVLLDLLQPIHPVHDCQVELRLLNMVSNDSLYSKHGFDSLTKSLACSEAELLIQNLICPRTKSPQLLEWGQFVAQGLAQNEC